MNRRGEMEKNTILEIRNMNISFSQYQKGTKQTKLPVIRLSIREKWWLLWVLPVPEKAFWLMG